MSIRVVIIGNGPAAVRALEAMEYCIGFRSGVMPEVHVISWERSEAYAPMFLVDYMTGALGERELLLLPEGREFSFPVRMVLGSRVVGLLERERKVVLEGGEEIEFDKLLIASGVSPVVPPLEGLRKRGVFFLNRLGDARGIRKATEFCTEVVVIGAGAIGIEAAIALRRLGKKVHVVELLGQILPQSLSRDLAEYVQVRLEDLGIEFSLGEGVSEVMGNGVAEGVVTTGGREIRGDLVLIVAGVRPNAEFVRSTAIEINRGILVNERMETGVSGIYAAGDVAESRNLFGDYESVFTWYSAVSQGWVAGCNVMGRQARYEFCPALMALKKSEFPVISISSTRGDGYEFISHRDEKGGVLEEIYIRDGYMECYQAIGVRDKVGLMFSFIKNRKRVDKLKRALHSTNFSAARMII